MMIRIIKKIQIFFLFIAVCILNAHMIIPHDHHQSDSDYCRENSIPVSDAPGAHHQGLPGHCHAFNDLVSGKVNSHHLNKQAPVRDLIPDSVYQAKVTGRQFVVIRIADVSKNNVMKGLPGISSLRAPPVSG
jgi:hypothetical protein